MWKRILVAACLVPLLAGGCGFGLAGQRQLPLPSQAETS
jgi:hypothetical protein